MSTGVTSRGENERTAVRERERHTEKERERASRKLEGQRQIYL